MKRTTVLLVCLLAVFTVAVAPWEVLAQGPTIQQIKQQQGPQSALQWATTMLGLGEGQRMATEVQILLLAMLVIPASMVISFWMKWAAKTVTKETSLLDYFFRTDPQQSLYAFLAAYGTVAGGAFTSAFSNEAGDFVGWYNVVYCLVVVGLGGDLGINKGSRTVWTDAQRAENKPAP